MTEYIAVRHGLSGVPAPSGRCVRQGVVAIRLIPGGERAGPRSGAGKLFFNFLRINRKLQTVLGKSSKI